MLKHYLTIAVRQMLRHRVTSLIQMAGLSVGLTVALLLFLYIRHELSYDTFHKNYDHIYRLIARFTENNGKESRYAIHFGNLAPEIKGKFPEVVQCVRAFRGGKRNVYIQEKPFQNNELLYVDEQFLQLFSFPLQYGEASAALKGTKGVVISVKTARKLFGAANPLGKSLQLEGKSFTVTAMVEVPAHSHLQFDLLLSLASFDSIEKIKLEELLKNSGLEFLTYVQLNDKADAAKTTQKIADLANRVMDERFKGFIKKSDNYLQRLEDVHLYSENISSFYDGGNINSVYLLSFLSLVILLVALVNYINLSIAHSGNRAREVGIRKVTGAYRSQLIAQFVGESGLIALLSYVLALGLVELTLPFFGSLVERQIDPIYWTNPLHLLLLGAIILLIGSLAGLYPALYLSSFQPVQVLKEKVIALKRTGAMSVGLLVFQFGVTTLLLVNLTFLHFQIQYMKSKEMGFNRENILIFRNLDEKIKKSYEVLKQKLLQCTQILNVSGTQAVPGQGTSGQFIYLKGKNPDTGIPINHIRTMNGYLETFGIKIKQGNNLDKKMQQDRQGFLLNETACKQLFVQGENPIGQQVVVGGRIGPVVGVISDFHYFSLKYKIAPLVINLEEPYAMLLAVKVKPEEMAQTIAFVEKQIRLFDKNYITDYIFMDQNLDKIYREEERSGLMGAAATLLAIFLSLLGLIALSAFIITRRTKEIAVRKVFGARLGNLIWVLIRNLLQWIVVANCIALPLSFLLIRYWMQNFAYHISLLHSFWVFPLVIFLVFLLAFATVFYRVWKTARTNPVKVLIYE